MRSAIRNGYSALGEHFRYRSYISMIYHQLHGYLHYVMFINDYVTDIIVTPDISNFIRELCICRDSGELSVLSSTEMSQLFGYICTI